ncbi:hypothetical protein [Pseudomonas sp. NA-150]|uniref:hypothetical protein n=1 Tax=Pseudomonas sp. NA-150 TaxID=3367525 RepID=UPI0037C62467
MKPSILKLTIAILVSSASMMAMGQQCQGLQNLKNESSVLDSLLQLVKSDPQQAECGALVTVLGNVVNTPKTGGRKLEEDRPFNAQAAQADLAKAQADPEVRKRLEKIKKEITDPTRRMIYEAATFDEEGYYGARDLRINQLKQQIK